MEHRYHAPPTPPDAAENGRWMETRRRRRLLEGHWSEDLNLRMLSHFGVIRRGVMGPASRSKNPFKRVCEELSSLYYETPLVHHASGMAYDDFAGPDGVLHRAQLWTSQRRFQVLTLGLREGWRRIDWHPTTGLSFRTVTPDTMCAWARSEAPSRPVKVAELRWREVSGRGVWTWDVFDVSDPANPSWRVLEHHHKGWRAMPDLTEMVLGFTASGADYPWRYTSGARAGQPFLPGVLYHAEDAGVLFDPNNWLELVEAALDLGCSWTFFQHALFRASWPQRWGMNVRVAGTPVDTPNGARQEVPSDPTSMIHLQLIDTSQPGQVGQWQPSINVKEMQEAIAAFESTVVAITGVDAAHIVRTSSDAWSGAALSINRDGKREAQRVYTPQFQPRDVELLEKSAAVLNLTEQAGLPEEGWRVTYGSIPLSPQELEKRREDHNDLIDRGRMSPVDAYMREHPGLTREEAIRELGRIAVETALVEALRAAALAEPAA